MQSIYFIPWTVLPRLLAASTVFVFVSGMLGGGGPFLGTSEREKDLL